MNTEEYKNVLQMLRSADSENHVLALSIMEQKDFKKNMAFILLAKKHGSPGLDLWEEHAPNTLKEIKGLPHLEVRKHFTYKDILQALTEAKAPIDQIQYYLGDFSNYMLEQMNNLGYDFIEEIEINVKLKPEYEPERELSESL